MAQPGSSPTETLEDPFAFSDSANRIQMESEMEKRGTEFVWKVPGILSLVQRWKNEAKGHVLSEVFVIEEFDFKIRAKLECYNDAWISLSIVFVKEEEEEATPTRPSDYFFRRTFALMDQSEGNGPKWDIVRIQEPRFGNEEAQRWMEGNLGWDWPFTLECFESGAPYVVDDALRLRILIEPLSVLWKSVASNDGTIRWRIDDYFEKKKYSIDDVIDWLYSDSFYTSPRGYRVKMALRIESDLGLRMCVEFLRGEWDDSLSERFPHKTILTILDQSDLEQKKHLIRTKKSESTTSDWVNPIFQSEVESGPYLKDDSLLVKVVVESRG